MRRLRSLALALLLAAPVGEAAAVPEGPAVVRTTLASGLLPRPVPLTVQLPPSYASHPSRRFPVLYFLHDARGTEDVLLRRGVAALLHREMASGGLPEMLIVAPRGTGSWYVDSFDGTRRFGTFLDRDLVPFVDAGYRTIPRRDARAAAGISMGGYGAARWGLRSPELLAAVGGLSPAVPQLSWRSLEGMPFFIRPSLTSVFGRSETENSLRENDLCQLLLSDPTLGPRAPRFVLRCGTEDKYRLGDVTSFFDRFLRAMGASSEVMLEPGGHDWTYWKSVFVPFARTLVARLSPPEDGTPR